MTLRKSIAILCNEALVLGALTAATAFLLETLAPGFVSAVIDLHLLFVLTLLLLAAVLFLHPSSFSLARLARWSAYLLCAAGLLFLYRLVALQRGSDLLGLVQTVAIIGSFIIICLVLYDRRSDR